MRVRLALTLSALVALATVARSQDGDAPSPFAGGLLICSPHSPGNPDSARPVMERFGAWLTPRLGQPCQPVYFNDTQGAREWLTREGPRFAILSLDLYLRWREELHLEPIAQAERSGEARERLHLVVRGDGPLQKLADLQPAALGRPPVVWSSHLEDARFATRVVFRGQLKAEGDGGQGRVLPTHQPLKLLRRLKDGQPFDGQPVDAVVVDDAAWRALQEVPSLAGALRELWTSEPLPTPPVVAFPRATPAERQKLAEVLLRMNDADEGKELLSTLQVTAFRRPDEAALAAAVELYAREAP